jgi:hypothetical protein
MKNFYFKIASFGSEDGTYCVRFSKTNLRPGEKGEGAHVSITAKDEEHLKRKLGMFDWDSLKIVYNPIGE